MKKSKKITDEQLLLHGRRQFIAGLFAANGYLGLRSMLLGVSPSFLVSRAMAAGNVTALIFSSDQAASPINCNAPGTYIAGLQHPTEAEAGASATGIVNQTSFTLGTTTVSAAQRWSAMPVALRNRFQFFHHASLENAHFKSPAVLELHGALLRKVGIGAEMLPSAIAQELADQLGTVSKKPIVLSRQQINFEQISQPYSSPSSLKEAFGPITDVNRKNILRFRDQMIDKLYADVKYNGTIRQAQFIESHALSRDEARSLIDSLSTLLNDVTGDLQKDQVLAAAAVIAAKAAPVATINITAGGDNHGDSTLATESAGLKTACENIELLWEKLNSFGIADSTTFALNNVFGRTLKRNSDGGRDHNRSHSVTLMFGPHVKGGVTGDVATKSDHEGGAATGINSLNGTKNNPDIPALETLSSSAKTLMKACGVNEATIHKRVTLGKIVRSAIS